MPTNVLTMLQNLSRKELERLLAAKDRAESLQNRRDELRRELAQVEAALADLFGGQPPARRGRGRAAAAAEQAEAPARAGSGKAGGRRAGKASKKRRAKAGRAAARKAAPARAGRAAGAKKAAAKKAGAKKVAAKKAGKAGRAAGQPAGARRATAGRPTLEDVVVGVIRKRGEPVPFQDLLATIMRDKLFKTRSSNFDNVLRRTLSTSKRVKRVGRGIYGI